MRKPYILITPGQETDPRDGSERSLINKQYTNAVLAGGGIPIIPMTMDACLEYAQIADGIVMTGAWPAFTDHGDGSAPKLNMKENLAIINKSRRYYEIELFHAFRDAGKPVLGICFGMQNINLGQDGTLNFHIADTYKSEHREGGNHKIFTEPGSLVNKVFGAEPIVNSYHGFCVDELGKDLKITARSPEGIPECLEHVSLPIFGFQWHPERMRGDDPNPASCVDSTPLFKYFADLCAGKEHWEAGNGK